MRATCGVGKFGLSSRYGARPKVRAFGLPCKETSETVLLAFLDLGGTAMHGDFEFGFDEAGSLVVS